MQFLSIVLLIIGSCLCGRCRAMGDDDLIFVTGGTDTPRAALPDNVINKVAAQIAEKFTLCFWVEIHCATKQKEVSLVSYWEPNQDNAILLEVHCQKHYTALTIEGVSAVVDQIPPIGQWTHICVSYDSVEGLVTFYFDGKQIGNPKSGPTDKIAPNGFMVTGQDQDSKGGDFDVKTGLLGRITKWNLWNIVLNSSEVIKNYKCQSSGNVVAWEDARWKLGNNMMVLPSTMKNCDPIPSDPQTCQKPNKTSSYDLNTPITTPGDHNNVRSILKSPTFAFFVQQFSICCDMFYNEPKNYTIYPISYINDGSKEILFGFSKEMISVIIGNKEKTRPHYLRNGGWNHFCVTWSSSNNGRLDIFFNGDAVYPPLSVQRNYAIPATGDWYLTQDQIKPLDQNDPDSGFNMKVTGLSVWNQALTPSDVKKIYTCRNAIPSGQVISPVGAVYEATA